MNLVFVKKTVAFKEPVGVLPALTRNYSVCGLKNFAPSDSTAYNKINSSSDFYCFACSGINDLLSWFTTTYSHRLTPLLVPVLFS